MAQEHPFLAVLGGICGSPWARVAGVLQRHLPGVEKKPTEKGCPELKVLCSKLEEPNICSAPPLVGDLGKPLGFLKICCKVVRTAA